MTLRAHNFVDRIYYSIYWVNQQTITKRTQLDHKHKTEIETTSVYDLSVTLRFTTSLYF